MKVSLVSLTSTETVTKRNQAKTGFKQDCKENSSQSYSVYQNNQPSAAISEWPVHTASQVTFENNVERDAEHENNSVLYLSKVDPWDIVIWLDDHQGSAGQWRRQCRAMEG